MSTFEKLKKSLSVFLFSFFDVPFFIGYNQAISPIFLLTRPALFILTTLFLVFFINAFDLGLYDVLTIGGMLVAALFSRSVAYSSFLTDTVIKTSFKLLLILICINFFIDFDIIRSILNLRREETAGRVTLLSSEPSFLTYTFFAIAVSNFVINKRLIILAGSVSLVYLLTISQTVILYTLIFIVSYIIISFVLRIFRNKVLPPSSSFAGLYIIIILVYLFLTTNLYSVIATYEIQEQGSWRGISNYWALSYSQIFNTDIDIGKVVSSISYEEGIPWITRPWSLAPAMTAIFGIVPAAIFFLFIFRRAFSFNIRLCSENIHLLSSAYAIIPIVLFFGPKWHFLGLIFFFYFLKKLVKA